MKNSKVFLVLAVLAVLVMPIMLLAQETGIIIPIPGLEVGWVEAALGLFGIGLVYIINFVKGLLKWTDKKAMWLTIGFGVAAAVITLVVKDALTVKNIIFYAAAVVGELTGWFKLVAKPKKAPVA